MLVFQVVFEIMLYLYTCTIGAMGRAIPPTLPYHGSLVHRVHVYHGKERTKCRVQANKKINMPFLGYINLNANASYAQVGGYQGALMQDNVTLRRGRDWAVTISDR